MSRSETVCQDPIDRYVNVAIHTYEQCTSSLERCMTQAGWDSFLHDQAHACKYILLSLPTPLAASRVALKGVVWKAGTAILERVLVTTH